MPLQCLRFWIEQVSTLAQRCGVAIFVGSLVFGAAAGTLNVSFNSIPAGSAVNLTTNGPLDWVHWGLVTETSIDRKGGVAPQISDFAPVDASNGYVYIYQFADNANGYTWSDGAPHMAVTNTTTGVWAYGIPAMGSGFRITAPASTNLKTLKVYVGAFNAKGRLTAALSDQSAPDYINPVNDAVNNVGNGLSGVYALSFAANSTGQTLTVTYTLDQLRGANGNVTLQAAVLTAPGANNIPFVTLTSITEGTSIVTPTNLTLTATATDTDGLVSFVAFYSGADLIGSVTNAPYSLVWTNPPAGKHVITARAIDDGGAESASVPITLFVATNGGSISSSRVTAPFTLNLTSEGTSDWAHWGLSNRSSFNHKISGASQISNFTRVGTNTVIRFIDNRTAFSWTDGAPVSAIANTNAGVYIYGLTNGFEFSVPADTNLRTLRVYAGLYGAQGNFQAWLSDFSGRAFTDLSLSNVFNVSPVVYTLSYAAASAGQQLHVRWTIQNLFDADYGNVSLAAATLQGPPPTVPVLLQNPLMIGSAFRFSFPSVADRNYAAQFTPSLTPVSWQTFTNLTGNGASLSVTDQVGTTMQRFYRVLSQ